MSFKDVDFQEVSGDGQAKEEEVKNSGLARIQRQLMPPAGSVPMQGYLLKRSETLRKWNQRWFTLDPSTAKMEYRVQRADPFPRGLLVFEADSTITVSPLNFHGGKQYEGCNFYIGGSARKEYFLCAETPGAARAWVATLRAAALVLKAHREAVQSIGDSNGSNKARAGAVAAATAMANATAREASKEISAANQRTVLGTHHLPLNSAEAPMDNVTIMKETLRVKDEELQSIATDMRSREATIEDLANRLSETAQAAEAAANAVHRMDKERTEAITQMEYLHKETGLRLNKASNLVKAAQEREAQAVAIKNEALKEVDHLKTDLAIALKRIEELQIVVSQSKAHASECEERERRSQAALEEALRESQVWKDKASRLPLTGEMKSIYGEELEGGGGKGGEIGGGGGGGGSPSPSPSKEKDFLEQLSQSQYIPSDIMSTMTTSPDLETSSFVQPDATVYNHGSGLSLLLKPCDDLLSSSPPSLPSSRPPSLPEVFLQKSSNGESNGAIKDLGSLLNDALDLKLSSTSVTSTHQIDQTEQILLGEKNMFSIVGHPSEALESMEVEEPKISSSNN